MGMSELVLAVGLGVGLLAALVFRAVRAGEGSR